MKLAHCSLVAFLLLSALSNLNAGGRENGGGHWLATEFRDRGRFIIYRLSEKEKSLLSRDQVQAFIASVADTRVEMTPDELVDEFGGPAKAVTLDDPKRSGQKLIRVREKDWQELLSGTMPGNTINIVFHEYLRSIDIQDFNEFTSSQLHATEEQYLEWIKTNRRAEENVINIVYPLSGDLIPDTVGASEEDRKILALTSYTDKAREWRAIFENEIREEIGDTIGIKGIFIDKSPGISSKHIQSISAERKVTDENLSYRRSRSHEWRNWFEAVKWQMILTSYPGQATKGIITIGLRAFYSESVQVHLEQNRALLKSDGYSLSTEVRYWNSNYKTVTEGKDHFRVVYDLAHSDYVSKCSAWKTLIRNQLANNWDIVFVDCGQPALVTNNEALTANEIIEVESGSQNNRRVHHYFKLQGYQMYSRGTVYYLQK